MGVKFKTAPVKVKAGPDDGLAEGEFIAYASVFDNIDLYGDVVLPGAFTKTLERWKDSGLLIPLLFGHRMDDPDYNLGHAEAQEDEHGLRTHGFLDLENPKSVQTYRMLKGRRINQMSFAYTTVQDRVAQKDGQKVNELVELDLHEISVVPLGANPATEVLDVKNADILAQRLGSGTVLTPKQVDSLRKAQEAIDTALAEFDGVQDDEASGTPVVNEEAQQGNSEEPPAEPSVKGLDAHEAELTLLGLGS